MSIVRCGGQEEKRIAAAGQNLGQSASLRILTVASRAKVHAVMGLVDDNDVVAAALQELENALLLEEVNGCQAKGDVVKGIGTKLCGLANLFETGTVDHVEAQAETLGHLCVPLFKQGAGRRDDQDTMGHAPGNELGEGQACFDGLAQAHAVGKQQSWAAHPNCAQYRD